MHSDIPIPKDFSMNSDDPPMKFFAHHPPPLRPPPTDQDKPIQLPKWRVRPNGTSAVGVSVLAVKGWIGPKRNPEIDLQLDFCADITLLSEEYYNTIRGKPVLRSSLKLKLWQLTDKGATIKGFVKLPVMMIGKNGELFETEAEAYIVLQGMYHV